MQTKKRAEGKRGQKHDMQDVLEPQAKTQAKREPRSGRKRESTQLLPDLEDEVTSTVLVVSGSAPIQARAQARMWLSSLLWLRASLLTTWYEPVSLFRRRVQSTSRVFEKHPMFKDNLLYSPSGSGRPQSF